MANTSILDEARRMAPRAAKAAKRYSFPVVKTQGPTKLPDQNNRSDLQPSTSGGSKRYPPDQTRFPKINGLVS
jgi:hypothetical protein